MTVDSPDERPPAIVRVGHYYTPLALVLVPIAFSPALTALLPHSTFVTVWNATSLAAAFLWMGVVFAMFVHNRNLCTLDVRQALDHDDPDAEVRKNRWKLWLYHTPIVASVVSVAFVAFAVVRRHVGDDDRSTVAVMAAIAVVFVAVWLTVVVGSDHAHRRLALWCPWCRRGGGHDPDLTPEPTPDPVVQARR
jgi:L-asparagine transporter-like permease